MLAARIWGFCDWCFFGPASTRPDPLGLTVRILRYPYAIIRDLLRGEINLRAMGLVYTTLLSIIPLVAFAFAVLNLFGERHDLEPIVAEFFRPLGGTAADELARQVVHFAHRASSGVAGWVGLVFLAYTLFGTIKKVEDSFNFVWHVDKPRGLGRRLGEYLILLVIGSDRCCSAVLSASRTRLSTRRRCRKSPGHRGCCATPPSASRHTPW